MVGMHTGCWKDEEKPLAPAERAKSSKMNVGRQGCRLDREGQGSVAGKADGPADGGDWAWEEKMGRREDGNDDGLRAEWWF